MKNETLKSQTMKAAKTTLFAVLLFGGILSTTSCGTISCHAYASNESIEKTEKAVQEAAPQWTNATFVEELPSS